MSSGGRRGPAVPRPLALRKRRRGVASGEARGVLSLPVGVEGKGAGHAKKEIEVGESLFRMVDHSSWGCGRSRRLRGGDPAFERRRKYTRFEITFTTDADVTLQEGASTQGTDSRCKGRSDAGSLPGMTMSSSLEPKLFLGYTVNSAVIFLEVTDATWAPVPRLPKFSRCGRKQRDVGPACQRRGLAKWQAPRVHWIGLREWRIGPS